MQVRLLRHKIKTPILEQSNDLWTKILLKEFNVFIKFEQLTEA